MSTETATAGGSPTRRLSVGTSFSRVSHARLLAQAAITVMQLTSKGRADAVLAIAGYSCNLGAAVISDEMIFQHLIQPFNSCNSNSSRSDVTTMHTKGASSDVMRASTSSAPSTSSHGSAQDDCDSSGDVYVWGEVICDNSVRTGSNTVVRSTVQTDVLRPKPLESNLVLDAYHVDCGVKHSALVTKNGEVFAWGEESGGRLGHGSQENSIHPRLVESLAVCNVDIVACGEFHTCAVTTAGELYTWGDGTHNVGLLGHGTDVSHWIPKRISGALEGLQVAYVSCGIWHTALITTMGQLFTFGDGTFGVLGHGNRESISCPREVESLSGLKTISVACGVWHTAAVVEVIATQSNSSISSGKLFTWGDGDKHRLGHGDKEPRLKPTCVASLIDYDFHKIACGHSLTVGLTTSGQVLIMGNNVYGQLGNPRSDGKIPCLVEEIMGEHVVQVACGSYHVAVLTIKSEVFTWGKGANGRLGHGDIEDRKIPTLVEALRDRKAVRAALAPNPAKPYRVCDSCFLKLNNAVDSTAIGSRPVRTSAVRSVNISRAVSPFSRKPSPPRSTTPVPTTHGLSIGKSAADNLAKTNEMLNQEVERLRAQVDNLRHHCEVQEFELQKSAKKVQEAMTLVTEESAKSKAAKEVIKSLTAQLKDMAERLPPDQGAYDGNESKQAHLPNGTELHDAIYSSMNGIHQLQKESISALNTPCLNSGRSFHTNVISTQHTSPGSISENSEVSAHSHRVSSPRDTELSSRRARISSDELFNASSKEDDSSSRDVRSLQNGEDGYKPRGTTSLSSNQVQAEWIEQYEPGVYITLTTLRDGTRDLKRVRFRCGIA
ncbi:hypothetical protein GUJ93_ZPchr0007g5726 [Zizania palustris]|uniref:BRX domain-containing protein n=1 Tax=Zizania palustris TaxID=103762 RepID=A0A8J5T3X6_ZIZPA|nr:hypothetical protein GUJ93_ZPchr0007g5726 [Zizania palustris]